MRRAILLLVLGIPFAYGGYVLWGLPARGDVRALALGNPVSTGVMRQREEEARRKGRTLRPIRSWVPLSAVSRHVIHAVVAAEDPNFFGHAGVDWDAVKESVEADVRKRGFVRGGSTITQQLAKNLFFTTHKSITRKLREFLVARWLEADLDKRRILELYLNVIEWGDGIYGCEAAARRYYGKPAGQLDEVEAAGLVAMIPSPRRLNPRANAARHARAQRRVLWLMAHAGYLRRSAFGLGAEPPPEPVPEDEEWALPAAEQTPAAEPTLAPSLPPWPTDEPTLPPEESPSPTPPAEMPPPSPGATAVPTPTPTPPPTGS